MADAFLGLALAAAMQVGVPAPQEQPNYPPLPNAYQQYGFEGRYEQRHPFDVQSNWVHGYHQELPSYPGYSFFRPYNYKHVLSQSQVAGGYGMNPTMPYSQQFWHRYQDQAAMLKLSQAQPGQPLQYGYQPVPLPGPAQSWGHPTPAMSAHHAAPHYQPPVNAPVMQAPLSYAVPVQYEQSYAPAGIPVVPGQGPVVEQGYYQAPSAGPVLPGYPR